MRLLPATACLLQPVPACCCLPSCPLTCLLLPVAACPAQMLGAMGRSLDKASTTALMDIVELGAQAEGQLYSGGGARGTGRGAAVLRWGRL